MNKSSGENKEHIADRRLTKNEYRRIRSSEWQKDVSIKCAFLELHYAAQNKLSETLATPGSDVGKHITNITCPTNGCTLYHTAIGRTFVKSLAERAYLNHLLCKTNKKFFSKARRHGVAWWLFCKWLAMVVVSQMTDMHDMPCEDKQ